MKAHLHNLDKCIIIIVTRNFPVLGDLGARYIQQEMQKATSTVHGLGLSPTKCIVARLFSSAQKILLVYSVHECSRTMVRARYLLSVMEESSCKMLGDGLLCC